MNRTLMRLVAENIAFLELSSDGAVDPDVAVREVESIAAALSQLTGTERDEFFGFVDHVLAADAKAAGRPELSRLYSEMRASMGL